MARSTVKEDSLFEDIAGYGHAVLAFIDHDGYPISVATSFDLAPDRGVIRLDRPALPDLPVEGAEVNVMFSHVRPQPGVGYDQRRYVCVWGSLSSVGEDLEVIPERTHGWDEERMSFFELCERSVPIAHSYMSKLGAEKGSEVKPRMSLGWLFFMATRVPFLTATIVPVLLGAMVARSHGFSAWWWVALALVGGAAIHLGLNVSNDVFDAKSGADEANVTPTMFSGGSRMIQYGLISLRGMAFVSIAFYVIGIAIGLFLTATRGVELLWIGAAGVFLSLSYTAPPLKLVHRGLGEIAVALGFGPIMVLGAYFVAAQQLSWEAFYASLPVALLIMLVLYVNQIPDRHADAAAGKRTIVVRLSEDAIVAGYAFSVATGFALIAIGALVGVMPVYTLAALVTIPMALKVHRGLRAHYDSPYELMGPMGTNIGLHLFAGLLLIAGYLAAVVI